MDHPVFDHEGPWTESAYRGLPRDRRIEVVDGTLLVGPSPTERQASAVTTVCDAIQAALPDGLRVVGPVPLRLGPDCVLVPDLLITSEEPGAAGSDNEVLDATAALMVIEVIGRDHGAMDRSFKPQLYARSSIPYSVLIDHDLGFAVAHMIIAGRYHEYARADGDQPLRLDEPFALTIDLAGTAEPQVAEPVAVGSVVGAGESAESDAAGPEVAESVVAEPGWADPGPADPEVVAESGWAEPVQADVAEPEWAEQDPAEPEGARSGWAERDPADSQPVEPEPGLTAQALAESNLAEREPGGSVAGSEVPRYEPVESEQGPAAGTPADAEPSELGDSGQAAPEQVVPHSPASDQDDPDPAAQDHAPPEPASVESDGQLPRREPRSRRQPRSTQAPAAS